MTSCREERTTISLRFRYVDQAPVRAAINGRILVQLTWIPSDELLSVRGFSISGEVWQIAKAGRHREGRAERPSVAVPRKQSGLDAFFCHGCFQHRTCAGTTCLKIARWRWRTGESQPPAFLLSDIALYQATHGYIGCFIRFYRLILGHVVWLYSALLPPSWHFWVCRRFLLAPGRAKQLQKQFGTDQELPNST